MTFEAQIIETMFRIADKEGNDVDFVLNETQRTLDENLSGRDLIPKARQEGVSSYFLARYTAACLAHRNVRAVVISHDVESTQRMLNKVKYFIENIRGPGPVIQNMSKNEITFPKMNSMFYIGTAGAKKFGRGDTITHLHCSEYAYWPNAAELMQGLLQAVPMSGEVAIESTGNGLNDYYSRCMRAQKGDGRFKIQFFPWHKFPEYELSLTDEEAEGVLSTLDDALGEEDLVGLLTPGQIAWRRMKLDEMNYDVKAFKQEYPMTLAECFQSSGNSIFYKVNYEVTDGWQKVAHDQWVLEGHPRKDRTYILGGDAAAGVGRDSAAIEVVCLEDMEQVCEVVNNKTAPDIFALRVAQVGKDFNTALAVLEQNNHGLVSLAYLRDLYPSYRIFRQMRTSQKQPLLNMGFYTSKRTKPLMIGELRQHLATDLTIHSPVLMAELSTYVENEDGSLGAVSGCHDDTVTALACACLGIKKAALYAGAGHEAADGRKQYDPFSLDSIIEELTGRQGSFFSPQHGGTIH